MKTRQLIAAVTGIILKILVLVLVVMALYKGAVFAYDYGYRIFMEPAVSAGEGRSVTVTITEGMSAAEIGELFAQKGLVGDGKLFSIQYLLSEFRREFAPGTYELNTSMTAEEMMEAIGQAAAARAADETGTDDN